MITGKQLLAAGEFMRGWPYCAYDCKCDRLTGSCGTDCSGFVFHALREAGYQQNIPPISHLQYAWVRENNRLVNRQTASKTPGAIAFRMDSGKVHHVGLLVGDGVHTFESPSHRQNPHAVGNYEISDRYNIFGLIPDISYTTATPPPYQQPPPPPQPEETMFIKSALWTPPTAHPELTPYGWAVTGTRTIFLENNSSIYQDQPGDADTRLFTMPATHEPGGTLVHIAAEDGSAVCYLNTGKIFRYKINKT